MSSATIRQNQRNFIITLNEQEILDNNFDNVLQLRNGNPGFVVEVIDTFFNDTDNAIEQLTIILGEPVVDYPSVINFVHQIRGASSSLGGRRMALACRELRYACNDMDRERCIELFNMVKREYQILKDNLSVISQMERTIIASESRRRRRR